MLANLDNEVIFKKVFTDRDIFKGFVKDVLNIDMKIGKIETEKRFDPKIGHIDFQLDIFAESEDNRVVIEIQRIEYDYNFDRFLHYFLMTIAELQRSYQTYGINKEVYGIVVMTAPYTISDKNQYPVRNEVMISALNPRNLQGKEVKLFNHQLVFLNAYHKDKETPAAIRDWLNLIYQSIHQPNNPQLNENNPLIKKAIELIHVDNLTPKERAARKKAEGAKVVRKMVEEKAREEGVLLGLEKVGIRCIQQGKTDEEIEMLTGLHKIQIKRLRERIENEKT